MSYQSPGGYFGYKILPGTFDRPDAAVIVTEPLSMATKAPLIPSALQLSNTLGLLLESTPANALEFQMKTFMPSSGVLINEMCDRSTLVQISFPTIFFYDRISNQWESLPTIRSDQEDTIMHATIPPDVLVRNGLQLMLSLATGVPLYEQNASVGAYTIPVMETVSIGREKIIKYTAASPLNECVIPTPSRSLEMQKLRLLKFRSLGAPVSMYLDKRPNETVKVEIPLITDADEVGGGQMRRRNLLQQTGGAEATVVFFNTTSQTWQTMDQCVLNSTAVPVSMVCSLDPSFFASNGLSILLAPVVTESTTTATLPGTTTTRSTTTTAASMIMAASTTPTPPPPVDTPPLADDFLAGIVVACIFLLVIVPSGFVGRHYYYVRHRGVVGTVPHVIEVLPNRPLRRWTRWRNSVRWGNAQFYDSVPSTDELGDSSIPELHASVGRFMDAAATTAGRRVD